MHVERFSYEREAVDRKRCTEYRRPYRTELLHRVCQTDPDGYRRTDPGLRQVPLQRSDSDAGNVLIRVETVCILLTLLRLDIKNIYPGFTLQVKYLSIHSTTTPEQDPKAILG